MQGSNLNRFSSPLLFRFMACNNLYALALRLSCPTLVRARSMAYAFYAFVLCSQV